MIGFSNSPAKNTTCEVKVTERSDTHSTSDDGKTIYKWGGYIDKKRFDWSKYNYMILLDGFEYDDGITAIFDLKKNEFFLYVYINEKYSTYLRGGNRWHNYNYVIINGEHIEFYYRYKSSVSSEFGRCWCPETVMFV